MRKKVMMMMMMVIMMMMAIAMATMTKARSICFSVHSFLHHLTS